LQHQSRQRRLPMKQLAEAIILSAEVKGSIRDWPIIKVTQVILGAQEQENAYRSESRVLSLTAVTLDVRFPGALLKTTLHGSKEERTLPCFALGLWLRKGRHLRHGGGPPPLVVGLRD
jgi:hypothetical protein